MTDSRQWVFHSEDDLDLPQQQMSELLGTKGASLRRLRAAGCHVPPWFTISTEACREYFAQQKSWPDGMLSHVEAGVRRLEDETRTTYGKAPCMLLLAIRSGAAVSMPGAMATILDCGLNLELIESAPAESQDRLWRAYEQFILGFAESHDELRLDASEYGVDIAPSKIGCHRLLQIYQERTRHQFPQDPWICLRESITAVWNSWNSPRAKAFRRMVLAPEFIPGTAVTVQVMAAVDVAGVMFTRPELKNSPRVVIEAVAGSGQRLVAGEVTPRRYVLMHDDQAAGLTIHADTNHETTSHKPLLQPQQARDLAELGIRLEEHFAEPLDIEWGWARGEWTFFQARSLASEEAYARIQKLREREIERLMESSQDEDRIWVRHQLSETLPAPTPLTWGLFRDFFSGNGGFGQLYRTLGYSPSAEVCERGVLELIAGKLYVQPGRVTELFAAGWPFRYDLDGLRRDRNTLEQAPTRFDERRVDETFLLRLPRLLWIMARVAWSTRRLASQARERFEHHALPRMRDYVARERSRDLTRCDQDELLRIFDERCHEVLDEFGPASLIPGLFGGLAFARLEQELSLLLGKEEGQQLARDLVSGLESEHITERDELLFRVARGEASIEQFLEQFGHRAVHELELSIPRWREDVQAVEELIGGLKSSRAADPAQQRERARQRRLQRSAELTDIISAAGGSTFLPHIRELLWHACELLPYREIGKHHFMMGYELIRQAACALGRQCGLGDLIFFCERDELEDLAITAVCRLELEDRHREWQLTQRIDLPDVIESDRLHDLLSEGPEPRDAKHQFTCTVLSPGFARGPALVVNDLRQALACAGGQIIICGSLDPGLTPILTIAKGLVVERGGALSHGAVVARQLGVPALGLPEAIRHIRTGDMLILDAHKGLLHIEHT